MPKIVRKARIPKTAALDLPADLSSPRPAAAPPRITPPRVPANVRARTRVLLSVSDGKIDWEHMAPEARRQFEELFKDPKFLAQFGLSGKRAGWDPDQVKEIYSAVGTLNQVAGVVFMRWPREVVPVLGFSKDEKEMLAEPTANLANKYASKFLQEHQELAVWTTVFFAIMQKKFMHASLLARQIQAEKNKHLRPPAPPSSGQQRVNGSTPLEATAPAPVNPEPPTGQSLEDLPEHPAVPSPEETGTVSFDDELGGDSLIV